MSQLCEAGVVLLLCEAESVVRAVTSNSLRILRLNLPRRVYESVLHTPV